MTKNRDETVEDDGLPREKERAELEEAAMAYYAAELERPVGHPAADGPWLTDDADERAEAMRQLDEVLGLCMPIDESPTGYRRAAIELSPGVQWLVFKLAFRSGWFPARLPPEVRDRWFPGEVASAAGD